MLPPPEAYAFGAVCALALFASVVAHELAHALVARRFGVRTSAITLFLFGGVATLEEEPASPKADALIALAGPALSAALALAAIVPVVAGRPLRAVRRGARRARPARHLRRPGERGARRLQRCSRRTRWTAAASCARSCGAARGDRAAATNVAARVGIVFALLFVAAGVFAVAATREPIYAWYAVLGAFLLRQGWSQERATRAPRTMPARQRSDRSGVAPYYT